MRKFAILRKVYPLLAFFLFGLLAILSSCTGMGKLLGITPTPTIPTSPTPSITPSPTKRSCPPSSSILTPAKITIPNYLVVILYDPGEIGKMEFEDGRYTTDIYELISDVFQKSSQPGDQYAIFRLGCRDYSCARVMNEKSLSLESPLIGPTPLPHSTLTPISTPTYLGQTLFERTEIARNFEKTVIPQLATATENSFIDQCAQFDWEQTYATAEFAWETTKVAARSKFLTQVANEVNTFENDPTLQVTPYSSESLFEGLRDVTLVFQNECSKYQKCILILFDDLKEWRTGSDGVPIKPSNFYINLNNVYIKTVMPMCVDVYQPDCTARVKNWEPELKSYGALNVELYIGEGLELNLINFLRR